MIGHIKLCLEEIEAEIDAAEFSVLGARARELLAEHIQGIRTVVETVATAGNGAIATSTDLVPPDMGKAPFLPRAA